MNYRILILLLVLFFGDAPMEAATAPANDDCSTALLLRNVTNYCSSPRQFTNAGAGASGFDSPGCFPTFLLEPDNDVWFKFTAVANTVNIAVVGAIEGSPKGTLRNPQFALYGGSCRGGLVEIACIGDAQGYNIVETFINDLAIGGTYYLRVDGRNGQTGSFQLCINNYNPVPSPSSDCSTAVVLCDKSSFTVPSITGAGLNRLEIPPDICLQEETSSAWYKWTCDKPGTLTFTLQPVNPSDDIDFAVFYLPNGVEDCSEKIPVRCMASGESVSLSFEKWQRCTGATGLSSRSYDLMEPPGCEEFDDNFVAALRMNPGESYALLVNNFHNTGNGFSIQFGGTATFKGPVAHFVVNKLRINQNQTLWVRNKSSFDGGIKKWEWNFGVGADPPTAKGIGPHRVRYNSSGKKSISLSIETSNGCQVTKVRRITVTDPPPPPPPPPKEEDKTEKPTPEEKPISQQPSGNPISVIPSKEDQTSATPPPPDTTAKHPPAPPPATTDTLTDYRIKYTATIFFESDSSRLESKDIKTLQKVMGIFHQHPRYKIIVEGHTNNIPDAHYCNQLASKRAATVIEWLKSNGVGEDRIIRKIFGKDQVKEKGENKFRNRKKYQKAVVKLIQRE